MAAKHRRDAVRTIRRRHDYHETSGQTRLDGDADDAERGTAAAAHANTNPYLGETRGSRGPLVRPEGTPRP
ncbi:MAG: hypothetical protein ABWY36_03180 [Leifsonia sp.]